MDTVKFNIHEDGSEISIQISGIESATAAHQVREALLVPANDGVKAAIMNPVGDSEQRLAVVGMGYAPSEVYPAMQRALNLDLNRRRKRAEATYEGLLIGIRNAYSVATRDENILSKRVKLYICNPARQVQKPDDAAYAPKPSLVGARGVWAEVPEQWFTSAVAAQMHHPIPPGAGNKVFSSSATARRREDGAWIINQWETPCIEPSARRVHAAAGSPQVSPALGLLHYQLWQYSVTRPPIPQPQDPDYFTQFKTDDGLYYYYAPGQWQPSREDARLAWSGLTRDVKLWCMDVEADEAMGQGLRGAPAAYGEPYMRSSDPEPRILLYRCSPEQPAAPQAGEVKMNLRGEYTQFPDGWYSGSRGALNVRNRKNDHLWEAQALIYINDVDRSVLISDWDLRKIARAPIHDLSEATE